MLGADGGYGAPVPQVRMLAVLAILYWGAFEQAERPAPFHAPDLTDLVRREDAPSGAAP